MTWKCTNDIIPLDKSFRHLLRTRIKLFFFRRNKEMYDTNTENEWATLSTLSHNQIEKEINYLTSDIPVEYIVHPISSNVSKFERLKIWHDFLDSYPDACYEHEQVSLPTRMYGEEPTNRVMMKTIQLILLTGFFIYIFNYPSLSMYVFCIIFILLWIAAYYI